MNERSLDGSPDDQAEHTWWYRLSSSAILVGAGVGWTSAVLVSCLAAPVSLAFGSAHDRAVDRHDDL
jgi:hypothetical protein